MRARADERGGTQFSQQKSRRSDSAGKVQGNSAGARLGSRAKPVWEFAAENGEGALGIHRLTSGTLRSSRGGIHVTRLRIKFGPPCANSTNVADDYHARLYASALFSRDESNFTTSCPLLYVCRSPFEFPRLEAARCAFGISPGVNGASRGL